ncbi:MAG: hypothetical protein IKC87_02630 [Clostridia bacterium]|nr:hypothetical protein [Clostridia bacterium]
MKKSNFAKLLSLVLVCVMLISTFSVLAFAEEPATESEIEIYSNNVLTGGTQRLMYAIKADEGAEFDLTVTDANGNEIAVSPYVVEGAESNYINVPSASKGDAMCYIFATDSGVAPQNIDEEVVATVTVGGEVVDTATYSVLEYVYNRLYVSANATDAEKAMFTALLEYADLADQFYNGDESTASVANYKYVATENCTSSVTDTIIASGTEVTYASAVKPNTAGGEYVQFTIYDYESGTESFVRADDNGEIVLTIDSSVKVSAELKVVQAVSEKVDFSAISAGSQYVDETRAFEYFSIATCNKGCHFTTQLRIYDSSSNDGWAILSSAQSFDKLVINVGYKAATLNVYVSTDGVEYTLLQAITTTTSYKDYTVDIGAANGYKYIKLDAVGAQLRIASITADLK